MKAHTWECCLRSNICDPTDAYIYTKKREEKKALTIKIKTIFFGRWMKFRRWRKYYDIVIVAFVTKHIYTWLSQLQPAKDAVGKEKVINYIFSRIVNAAMLLVSQRVVVSISFNWSACWCFCYCSWWEWDHSEEFPLRDVHDNKAQMGRGEIQSWQWTRNLLTFLFFRFNPPKSVDEFS